MKFLEALLYAVTHSNCVIIMSLVRYNPRSYYERVPELRQCIDMIASGYFSPEDPNLFRNIVSTLLDNDRFVPFRQSNL